MSEPLRLDLGCGGRKQPGFVGVDQYPMDGVDVVLDLGAERWPWEDSSVDEIFSSHFLEHLDAKQRCHMTNEAYRVLKPGKWVNGQPAGGHARFIVPHFASCRAYGDPTHAWPPLGEFWHWYLDREWRLGSQATGRQKGWDANAPHADRQWNPWGYDCDFEGVTGNGWNPALNVRNEEYKQFAMQWYKEAIHDLHILLVARK